MSVQRSRIDLLRHGACEGGEIFRGSTDVALSEEEKAKLLESTRESGVRLVFYERNH